MQILTVGISIILYGLVFQTLSMAMQMVIRAEGNVRIPMIGMILGAVLNIVLDAVLIIPMGIRGAAIATVISQFICLLFFLGYYMSGKNYLKLSLKNMIIDRNITFQILSIGMASFAMLHRGLYISCFPSRTFCTYIYQ